MNISDEHKKAIEEALFKNGGLLYNMLLEYLNDRLAVARNEFSKASLNMLEDVPRFYQANGRCEELEAMIGDLININKESNGE